MSLAFHMPDHTDLYIFDPYKLKSLDILHLWYILDDNLEGLQWNQTDNYMLAFLPNLHR